MFDDFRDSVAVVVLETFSLSLDIIRLNSFLVSPTTPSSPCAVRARVGEKEALWRALGYIDSRLAGGSDAGFTHARGVAWPGGW